MGRVENGRVPPLSLKARVRLYFVVGFTACTALSGALFASKFHEFFFDAFGDKGNLPACTNVVLHTAPFWALIPVLMLLLFYWSMRGVLTPGFNIGYGPWRCTAAFGPTS